MRIAILFAFVGGYLCCTGEPRADTASAMRALCGARGAAIAPLVDGQSQVVPALLLGALIASESGCKAHARSPVGLDIGLGQIRLGGSAGHGYTARQLLDPATNVRLTAAHLRRCIDTCGGYVLGGLSLYRGLRGCKDSKGSRRVMRLLEKAQRVEARS